MSEYLSNNSLFWQTVHILANFTASKIVESGSSKPEMHTKVLKKREKLFMSAYEKCKPQDTSY